MKAYSPSRKGEIIVKPGRRVIWMSRPSRLSILFSFIAVIFIVIAIIAGGVPVVPWTWYRVSPAIVGRLEQFLGKPVATKTI